MRKKATLEQLLRRMRTDGRAFGRRAREQQGKPQMPEPVRTKNGVRPRNYRMGLEDAARISIMCRLGLKSEAGYWLTWPEFFNRTQEEIDASREIWSKRRGKHRRRIRKR